MQKYALSKNGFKCLLKPSELAQLWIKKKVLKNARLAKIYTEKSASTIGKSLDEIVITCMRSREGVARWLERMEMFAFPTKLSCCSHRMLPSHQVLK